MLDREEVAGWVVFVGLRHLEHAVEATGDAHGAAEGVRGDVA